MMEGLNSKYFDEILKFCYQNRKLMMGTDYIAQGVRKNRDTLKPYFDHLILLGLCTESISRQYELYKISPTGINLILKGINFETYVGRINTTKKQREELEAYELYNAKHSFKTNSITFYLMVIGALTGFYAFLDAIFNLTEKIKFLF